MQMQHIAACVQRDDVFRYQVTAKRRSESLVCRLPKSFGGQIGSILLAVTGMMLSSSLDVSCTTVPLRSSSFSSLINKSIQSLFVCGGSFSTCS
jgi:hypothetical protein